MLLFGGMLLQFVACMHASIMNQNSGFCMLSATRYLGHGMVALHKIEEGAKFAALYHKIAKRQQVFYKRWSLDAGYVRFAARI